MPNIDVTLVLTDTQAQRLNLLRQYYNDQNTLTLDKHEFATLLVKDGAKSMWKEFHNNFFAVLDAFATATDEEQDQIKAILGL